MIRRKFNLLLATLVFVLILAFNVDPAYASEILTETSETSETSETEVPVYRVTIAFKGNGGSGTMSNLTVSSDAPTTLPANKFKKTGYKFDGWNTAKDGSGTAYTNKQDVTGLATSGNDGSKITLYAQWKLTQPKIKKANSKTPTSITVTFKKSTSVSGYEIQYSTGKNFKKKNTLTATAAKSASSAELTGVTPGKTYYIRMRSYKKSGGKISHYSEWSTVVSAKVKNGKTIENTSCSVALEADVKLSGSGTGYHAKLVFGNGTSAVSFGMQYDAGAEAPYTGKNMALIENISSNNSGGQNYVRPGNVELKLNTTYHLMMAMDESGRGAVYVDYQKIGDFYQPNMSSFNYMRIESCVRLNNDSVNAEFSNIRFKVGRTSNVKEVTKASQMKEIKSNPGLSYKYDKKNNVFQMFGTGYGINGDWDSDFDGVSENLEIKWYEIN